MSAMATLVPPILGTAVIILLVLFPLAMWWENRRHH